MNIIVLMMDSYRQDHFGFYNQGQGPFAGIPACRTPHMDAFAAESVVFDSMYADSLPTIPARTSLFTGNRTLTSRAWQPLAREDTSVATILALEGYTSGLVADVYHYRAPDQNFHAGFHSYQWVRGQEYDPWRSEPPKSDLKRFTNKHYDDLWLANVAQFVVNTEEFSSKHDWFGHKVADLTCDWLTRNRGQDKLFLWMDSFDPHEPWDPPAEFDVYGDPAYSGPRYVLPLGGEATNWYSQAEIDNIRALYAGEAATVDDAVGMVLNRLAELGYYDDSVIVLMGDHGHPLADHGKFLKGADRLYNELLRIPFMVRLPGGRGARRTGAICQYHDLLPTLLDVAGLANCAHDMHGRSFRGVLEGESDTHRDAIITGYHEGIDRVIRNDRWSLILRPEGQDDELYDLVADPAERNNLREGNDELAADLTGNFGQIYLQVGTRGVLGRRHGLETKGHNLGIQGMYEMSTYRRPPST